MKIERRRALAALLCLAAGPGFAPAALAQARPATPPQPRGPFYPRSFPAERDADLARYDGRVAQGEALLVSGRVLTRTGAPVADARVEIWQTNAHGRYHHEGDDSPAPWDPGFQGWGATTTGADGAYRFRTVRPAAYSGRTAHIHYAVSVPGRRTFYTQLYFADAAGNQEDFLFSHMSEEARRLLSVRVEAARGGEPASARFDIVLE